MSELKVNVLGQGNNRLELAKLKDILARAIVIPNYQRPYAWNEENMEELFETIQSNYGDNKKISFLGSVIFCQPSEQQIQSQEQYFIIDGQQRLTSLLIVLRYIANKTIESELTNDLNSAFNKLPNQKIDQKIKVRSCQKKLKDTNTKLIDCINKSQIKRNDDDVNQKENHIIEYVRNNTLNHDSVKKIVNGIKESLENIEFKDSPSQPNITEKADFYCEIAEYILEKVQFCWLSIAGQNAENFAIDMFNTMNSTGEPLTGFEVFKSNIYKLDQSQKNEHKKIDKIQKNISKFFDGDRKKIVNHTGKFILFLSLYRKNGYKNKTYISDKNFKKQKNCIDLMLEGNHDNIASICSDSQKIYNFYFEVWLKKRKKHQHKYKDETGFCFSFLSDISHDRVLPILLHFDNSEIDTAIKTCAAFSALWRAFFWGGTAGIDQIYIKIAKDLTEKEPTIKLLQNTLIGELIKGKVTKKQQWMDRMKEVAIYKNKKLSRFLILVASNMLTYEKGILKKTTKGFNMLNSITWSGENEDYKTIEHIVPQNEQIDNPTLKIVHVLGNLTLLPSAFNSSLRNACFSKKQKEFEKSCQNNTTDTLPYLPILKELLDIDDFNQKVVDKRTEKLGSIIWDKLAVEWLGFKE